MIKKITVIDSSEDGSLIPKMFVSSSRGSTFIYPAYPHNTKHFLLSRTPLQHPIYQVSTLSASLAFCCVSNSKENYVFVYLKKKIDIKLDT